MADDGLRANEFQDALQTVELDDLLHEGDAPRLPLRPSPRALWRLALGLMIVDGVLALVASFAPWVIARFTPFYAAMDFGPLPLNDPTLAALLGLILSPLMTGPLILTRFIASIAILIAEIVYDGLGAFIGVALCFRWRERTRRRLLLTYTIWLATLLGRLLVCTTLLAVDARSVFSTIDHIYDTSVASVAPAGGFWLAWLAALLGVVCLVLARYAVWPGLAPSLPEPALRTPRTPMELASAGVATVGVVVWEGGFFTLPWATQGCSGLHFALNHFFTGTCAGLDSADMLSRWSAASGLANVQYSGENPFAVLLAAAAIVVIWATVLSLLVAAMSVCAVALLWLGPQGSGRYGLLLFCLIASGFYALAAWQGAGVALAHPTMFTYDYVATGPWVYGPGVAVTFTGLALAALGLVGAFASRWSQARRR